VNPVTSFKVIAVLSVVPLPPVIATVIAVPKAIPPSKEINTGLLLNGIGMSRVAGVVPNVGVTTLKTFKYRVAAFELTSKNPINLPDVPFTV
jgi:hypothetical protein